MFNEAANTALVLRDNDVPRPKVNEKLGKIEADDVDGLNQTPLCLLKEDVVLTGSMSVSSVCVTELVDVLDQSGKSGSF